MDLYNVVLSDPQRIDWAAEPMESMASMVMPHGLPIEHWFEAAWNRKQYDVALEIADRARRHRFLCSLPLGGRVQILRWLLSAPDLILPQQARLDRQDILARYPAYEQLAKQAADIEVKLRAQPPVAAAEATREQKDLVAQLAVVSQQQDTLLREIAMRREPAEILFPPLRTAKFIRDHLPDGHALLVFYATSRHLYGFLANNQQYSNWQIGPPQPLNKRLADLLRQMGQFEQNHELTVKEVADDQWKAAAHSFLDALLKGSRADFSQPLEELIIVPDGVLWYVPFEALQVDVGGKTRALLSRFRIRYVPLATLAIPDGRNRKPAAQTAVAVGPLYTRDSEATGRVAADEIAKVLPGTVLLPNPMPAPGASYLSVFDRLIVLDQIAPGDQAPYGWTPVPSDRGKVGDSLDDWLALPWQKPEELVLPGFHTAAENAMKRVHAGGAGQELFLEVCGMMASGARTILLSRWRTGGRSAYDLTREFVQELPHTSAADAWQRAVFLLASTRLTLEAEPRVKHATNDEAPKVTHPFFWAGYMLVDSAGSAQAEEAAKQEVVKIRQPDAKPAPAAPQPDANPARKPGAKTR
jgi:hypothetical protein